MLARVLIAFGIMMVALIVRLLPGAVARMFVEVLHTKETDCSPESYNVSPTDSSARRSCPYRM